MLCARTQAKVVTHTYYGCNNAGEGSGDVSIGKCGGHAPIGKLAPDGFRDSARSVCVCYSDACLPMPSVSTSMPQAPQGDQRQLEVRGYPQFLADTDRIRISIGQK